MSKKDIGLQYLNELPPWSGKGGFGIEAIKRVMEYLGNPQDSYPTMHIAGTNGKGSVSAAVSSILGSAGYCVGLNSSPHLVSLNERLVIDGYQCTDELLGEVAYEIKHACVKSVTELSFHEALTAIAALGMREVGVDWGVFEVGLGGRFDASNVISRPAAVSIVTIDYDHQHILGDSLVEIAREKSGIIKPGSAVITGILPKEVRGLVSEKAKDNQLIIFGRDFDARIVKRDNSSDSVVYWGKNPIDGKPVRFEYRAGLPGEHQAHNLSVAATMALAVGIPISEIQEGLKSVFWPGRLEVVSSQSVDITMDCAHNPAGVKAFFDYVSKGDGDKIDLTFGVLDTKNWRDMLQVLLPKVDTLRLVRPESDRALDLGLIEKEIQLSGIDVRIHRYEGDYERCLHDILASSENGKAYITGSMYMIGAMRAMLGVEERPLWKRSIAHQGSIEN